MPRTRECDAYKIAIHFTPEQYRLVRIIAGWRFASFTSVVRELISCNKTVNELYREENTKRGALHYDNKHRV